MDTLKRRMEQLINGRFEYEVPKLLLSGEEIRLSTTPKDRARGELVLAAEDRSRIKGIAWSSHRRFLLGKEKFSGEQIQIPYGVDAKGLKDGDTIEGEVVLSTSIGEYRVPFFVLVKKPEVKSSQGTLGSFDDFVKLAREDFREAYRLFLDPSFAEILKGEPGLLPAYGSMSKNPVPYQNLEEFLIGSGRKQPVMLSLEKDRLELYEVQTSLKDTLRLKRSGWGYLRAEVTVEGDFLEVEKKVIGDGHFIGSYYDLEYIIRKENLGRGKNYGRIRIQTVYQTLTYTVTVSKGSRIQVNVTAYEKRKRLEGSRDFLAMCMGKLPVQEWAKKALQMLEELAENGYFSVESQLYEAYVHTRAGDKAKARMLLDALEKNQRVRKEETVRGAFYYVDYLAERSADSSRTLAEKIWQLYRRRPDSFLLLLMVMELNQEEVRSQSGKLFYLEEQYRTGCRSPLLYLKACGMAAQDGTVFRKLNDFTIQVLRFAAKNQILTEEMAFRAVDLAGQMKVFSKAVYQLLEYIYETYPSEHVIRAICQLIMKGEPRREEYFRWYELAVEAELKITGLYEYYIETMSRNYQKVLPKVIRLYFGYNNTLSDQKKAFVYSSVIRNKAVDRETYLSYQSAMEKFAVEKIKEGRMNEDFAVVYQEFCTNSKDENVRAALGRVMFTYRLYCDDPKIRKVIVRHGAFCEEQVYVCADKTAYIHLYSKDAVILFEDSGQRRYTGTVDYNCRSLLDIEELAQKLQEVPGSDPGLLLYLAGDLHQERTVTKENAAVFEKILKQEAFCEEYRQNIRKKLLLYYQEHMENTNLRSSLMEMDFREFAKVNKELLITILVHQNMYPGAYDLLTEYGYEGVPMPVLLRLCSKMVLAMEFEYDEELVLLACHIVKEGVYDEALLQYLVKHFEGPVKEMAYLWQRAMGFGLDCYQLEEKILIYSMFTRYCPKEGLKILEEYISQGGRELVILSYLTFESYGYFVGEEPKADFLFEALEKITDRKWECDIVCRLALLKHYTETGSWSREQMERAEKILAECEKQNLRFAFFGELPKELLFAGQLEDKVFAQCRAEPGAKVILHYKVDRENAPGAWKTEPVKERYQGFYNKEFILFYGEVLHYYFETEKDGRKEIGKEETLTISEGSWKGTSKYQMINSMLVFRAQKETEQLKETVVRYQKQEKMIDELFGLMD